jgi:hypothetical protein
MGLQTPLAKQGFGWKEISPSLALVNNFAFVRFGVYEFGVAMV